MPSGQPQSTVPRGAITERLGVACLCAAAVFGPVALGGTPTWARFSLEAAMTVAAVSWAVSASRPRWLVLLPLGLAAILCLQCVPLPLALLRLVAPFAAEAWQTARLGTADAQAAAWATISVDPGTTATGIRRLLLSLATLAAVSDLGSQAWARRWLTTAIACSAIVIWGLGLAFRVDSRERVLLGWIDLKSPLSSWQTTVDEPVQTGGGRRTEWVALAGDSYLEDWGPVGDGFGSYICSNHFAGAIYLTLPIALGLWLWLTRGLVPAMLRHGVALAAIAGAVWTTGRLADSRAGAAATLLAGLVLVALAMERPWPRRIAAAAALGYAACLFVFMAAFFGPWTGLERLLPPGMQQPLRALRSDGRVLASRVAGAMVAGSPLLGTGVGTFGDVQPAFIGPQAFLAYAHNDYVQLVAETGLVGTVAALCICGLLVARFRRFRRACLPPDRILDAGPWAALAGLALHSAFDWNLHVPANALLASLVAGLCVSSSACGGASAANSPPRSASRRATALFVAACIGALGLLGRDAFAAVRRRDLAMAIASARLAERSIEAPSAARRLKEAIAAGERADAWDYADARRALLMGRAHLHAAAGTSDPAARRAAFDAAEAWFAKARTRSAVSLARFPVQPR
jgi:hypothetical protein